VGELLQRDEISFSFLGVPWLQPSVRLEQTYEQVAVDRGMDVEILQAIHESLGFRRPQVPTLLADPTKPEADVQDQEWWPLDDIGGWLELLFDGIVTKGPEEIDLGGRSVIYFEAEVTDPDVCGPLQHCAGFVINTFLGRGFKSRPRCEKPGPATCSPGLLPC
jgi:hypothetical protein